MMGTTTLIDSKGDTAQTEAYRDLFCHKTFDKIHDYVGNCNSGDYGCRGGSRPRKAANIYLDREAGAVRFLNEYFSSISSYPDHLFEHHFRVSRAIFLDVCHKLKEHGQFSRTGKYVTGKLCPNT